MKRLILFSICICCTGLFAQRKPKIKGNKSVIEVSEMLPSFHSIELRDDLEIYLRKSDEEGYNITADDNLIDVLKFEVIDSTLIVRSFYTITGKKQLDISVRYNELREITLKDGKMISDAVISADEIKIHSTGYSQVELQFSAAVAVLNMSDNSKAELNIDADSLAVKLKDKVEANVYSVSNTQSLTLEDDALANMEGSSDTLRISTTGSTKLRAEKLESGSVDLETSDRASSRINAIRELHLSSSGSAKIYLYGEPVIEIERFSDNSELYKRTE